MKTGIYTLGALAIATSISFAQETPKAPESPAGPPKRERTTPEESFKKLDTNSDGSLSLDEFKASPMGKRDATKTEEIYKKMDKDADGKVTLEEYKANRPSRRGGAGGPGKGGNTPPPPAPK